MKNENSIVKYYISIHKAKEIILLLNELAQIILTIPKQKDLLDKIDMIKKILEEAQLKEDS